MAITDGTGPGTSDSASDSATYEETVTDYLPKMDGDTELNTRGLIKADTFALEWEAFTDDSGTSLLDSGEMTIYKYRAMVTDEGLSPMVYNLYESIVNTGGDITTTDTETGEDDTTILSVGLDSDEASALEAKYSQTDYSISDVSYSLINPGISSITGSIGTAFSSTISEALTTSRLDSKFTWNKSKQKPFKKPNETAIGIPMDDEQ